MYWLAKIETAVVKLKSILTLLEFVGVEDIELFDTRSSHIVREMVIMLSDFLKVKLISNIKKAGMYALLTEEIMDIPNMQELLKFVKYQNIDTGEPETKFLHTAESDETRADAKSTFEGLKNLIQNQLQLDLADHKAFVSDGASAMTGREKGVAARFHQVKESSTMLNVHCVCRRLALACSDTGDELNLSKTLNLP